jgi:hypothetical protein
MKEWFSDFGIDGPSIVAGFSGGMVRIIFDATFGPVEVLGGLTAGALTANYLGGPIAETLHLPVLGTAFIVGFGGLQIASMILSMIRQKIGGPAAQQPFDKGSSFDKNSGGPANVG